MNYSDLRSEIEAAPVITIYRHTNPDCDAVGSQFGLKNWIQENYPDKEVYACGHDQPDQGVWPRSDEVKNETIISSLAIVLDTGNTARIDDQRYVNARRIVKVDHHPDRESYGDASLVNETAAATCQILACFMKECTEQSVSLKTAEFLYCGILTDTLNFTTSNTTADTLLAAGYLCQFGVRIPMLARSLFDKSLNGFRFSAYVRNNVEMYGNGIAYEILSEEVIRNSEMTASKARSFIDELGHVKDFEIWCIFTEKKENGKTLYDGSLRSKTAVINDIAEMFHGGGHKNASGVKNLTQDDIHKLLVLMNERIHKKNA